MSPPYPFRFHLSYGTPEIWGGRDVTRIKPRSAANARNQHLNIPNINTPGKTTIKQLIHNIYSVNSVSLLSKARPANKYDCSKDKTVPIRLTLSFSRHWIRSPKLHDDAVGCRFHISHIAYASPNSSLTASILWRNRQFFPAAWTSIGLCSLINHDNETTGPRHRLFPTSMSRRYQPDMDVYGRQNTDGAAIGSLHTHFERTPKLSLAPI